MFEGLQIFVLPTIEVDISSEREKLVRTSLTKVSFQLAEKSEEDRTDSWADFIKDYISAVSVAQPENTVNIEQPNFPQWDYRHFLSFMDHPVTVSLLGKNYLLILVCISVII